MALGAATRDILGHVLLRSVMMVGPGLAMGLAASLAGGRLVQRLLYNVPPTDPVTFAAMGLALALVAFGASAWPAWRAARINPIQALRGE
jgi:ABC-type antimicrobial peptide transport system permease subunit